MAEHDDQLKAITEMRDLMNRSSRFLSLSGISGVCAGVFALLGAGAAMLYFSGWLFREFPFSMSDLRISYEGRDVAVSGDATRFILFFGVDAGLVLFFSLLTGWFFSRRKAKRDGVPFWDGTASRALINLGIPLVAGGFFCLALLLHGAIGLIAPATLVFYGLALVNASKYTVNDIRYLGLSEILLGLLAMVFIGYGLLFWSIGFGVLHIVYGLVLYFKYER